jgi:hypothetical protein
LTNSAPASIAAVITSGELVQCCDNGDYAVYFFLHRNRRRAGSRRFTANIEKSGALDNHFFCAVQHFIKVNFECFLPSIRHRIAPETRAIGERIGRDIEHSHAKR